MSNKPILHFNERLNFANGYGETIDDILNQLFPLNTEIITTNLNLDLKGADRIIKFLDRKDCYIDAKIRDIDFKRFKKDDVALEIWSKINLKVGWTRDLSKITDCILWYWRDSHRYWLCPFPELRLYFISNWQILETKYRTEIQTSDGWQSQCVFVPRQLIIKEIFSIVNPELKFPP